MPDALVSKGLELFATGDLEGAARLWLEARRRGSSDPKLTGYLERIRARAPDVMARVDQEDSLGRVVPPSELASALGNAVVAAVDAQPDAQPDAPAEVDEVPIDLAHAVEEVVVPQVDAPTVSDRLPVKAPEPPVPIPVPPVPVLSPSSHSVPSGQAPVEGPAGVPSQRAPSPADDPWGSSSVLGPTIEVSSGSAGLTLISAPPTPQPIELPREDLVRGETRLRQLLDLDDFTGALAAAEELLTTDPDHALARHAREQCRATLMRIFESKVGNLQNVPRVLVPPEQVIWLDLDHRSGFVLAQVDGVSTFEELIELTGLDRLEALRIVAQLVQKGVVGTS